MSHEKTAAAYGLPRMAGHREQCVTDVNAGSMGVIFPVGRPRYAVFNVSHAIDKHIDQRRSSNWPAKRMNLDRCLVPIRGGSSSIIISRGAPCLSSKAALDKRKMTFRTCLRLVEWAKNTFNDHHEQGGKLTHADSAT